MDALSDHHDRELRALSAAGKVNLFDALHSPAMARAMDQIEANAAAFRARESRLAADPRLNAFKAMHRDLDGAVMADGMAAGMQVFATLASDANARRIRVGALIVARIGQIDGNHSAVKLGLAKAARLRPAAPIITASYRRRVA